jgi:two-component system, OmpR family, KDP operon response regulator KdpE
MNDLSVLVLNHEGLDQGFGAALRAGGLQSTCVGSVGEAVRHVMRESPDAVLAMLPDAAAPDLCEVLRALGPYPLIVAGKDLREDVAAACLDRGGDAVIMLPMAADELAGRVRAVCRRAADEAGFSSVTRVAGVDLTIDANNHLVWYRGKRMELSPTEFRLLSILAESRGGVVTNQELLTRVWGEDYVDDLQYVRLYIGYLRAKFEEDIRNPKLILTQWGVGYRLAVTGSMVEA